MLVFPLFLQLDKDINRNGEGGWNIKRQKIVRNRPISRQTTRGSKCILAIFLCDSHLRILAKDRRAHADSPLHSLRTSYP